MNFSKTEVKILQEAVYLYELEGPGKGHNDDEFYSELHWKIRKLLLGKKKVERKKIKQKGHMVPFKTVSGKKIKFFVRD